MAAVAAAVGTGFTFYETWRQANAAAEAVTDGKSALQSARDAATQAKRQADIAEKAYAASVRSWLDFAIPSDTISVSVIGDISSFDIHPAWTIYGNTPITRASFNAAIFPGEAWPGEREKTCFPDGFRTIFPGDKKITFTYPPVAISQQSINIYWHKVLHRTGQLYSTHFPINLATCVSYFVVGDNELHYTFRAYDVFLNGTPPENCVVPFGFNTQYATGDVCLKTSLIPGAEQIH